MGKTQNTGRLTNGIFQDSSNNIAIGDSTASGYKFKVTGTSNLNGALSGTSATFSGTLTNGGNVLSANTALISTDSSLSRYTNNYLYLQGVTAGGLWLSGSSARTNNIAIRNSTNEIQFDTNSATRMFITSTGNVGIGTSSPASKLNVVGKDIYLTGETDNRIRFSTYGFTGDSMGAAIGYVYGVANTQEQGNLAFYTNPNFNSTGSLTERMRITSGGEFIVNSTTISNGAKAGIYFSDATNNGLILREMKMEI